MSLLTKRILSIALFVLLLVWGGYGLLSYLGILVHQLVLVSDSDRATIGQACTAGNLLCQGWYALLPFITFTISRAAPFLWYGIISLAVFAAVLGWQYFTRGKWTVHLRLHPWTILLFFLGSLFLIFNVLALGYDGPDPVRRMIEPLPQVYKNATPATLKALQDNFSGLKDRGCLTHVGTAQIGAEVYDMKISCIEGSFFTRVLPQLAMVLLLLFEFLVLGRMLLSWLRPRPRSLLVEMMVSAGLGACGIIAILWLLAIVHLYVQLAGWLLFLSIPLIGYRHTLYWVRRFLWSAWESEEPWYSPAILLAWLLLGYLAFNFLTVIRPFPIGWDDLGRYLNHARLVVSYGHFIPSLATFQWQYVTSLGFLLFGFESVFAATFSMLINWTAGLMATLSIFVFGNVFLGHRRGMLAALLYYTLPLVGHFSYADMKIDNAVFAMGTLATLCFFLALFPMHNEEDDAGLPAEAPQREGWQYMALAGIFSGFAFAIKPTAVMVLMSLATTLFGITVGVPAFFGTAFLGWVFYTWHTEFNVAAVSQYVYGSPDAISRGGVLTLCIGAGLLLFAYGAWRNRQGFARGMQMLGVFTGSLFLAMGPWLLYNNIVHRHFPPRLEMGAPDHISPIFSINLLDGPTYGQDVRVLPPDLRPDMSSPSCRNTSKAEEVDRYWGTGYGKGWSHYITLPWRTVMNTDSTGYYVTTIPALLLFPLLFLLPFLWSKKGRPILWMTVGTLFIIFQWVFFANGIPWYGVGMFLGLMIGLEVLVSKAPDRITATLAGVLVGLSLLMSYGQRLWQFDQQKNLFEYPMGKISAEAIRQRTIPYYDLIRDIVVERHDNLPDRPYVYRVGTFIPYFIPKNLEYLPMTDNQLDFFNCLFQERDTALTLERLKAFGFSSILFDTNTQTIEKDPNGTLHKKVQAFINFLNTPALQLQVVVNDPDAGVAYVLIP